MRAGTDDVEVAIELGRTGSDLRGDALYEVVRQATGGERGAFVAETKIPRLAADTPPQNWQAPDAMTLWASPIVGDTGTTVGEALAAMLEPGGQFIRQLEGLGEGLAGSQGVFGNPLIGPWLSQRCCQALHDGFVVPLAHDPAPVVLGLVDDAGPSPGVRARADEQ